MTFTDPAGLATLDAGLPPGTIAHAVDLARAGGRAVVALVGGGRAVIDAEAVAAHVLLPAVLAARAEHDGWTRPAPPRPAPGRGLLAADLGAPGDEDAYARLLATLPPDADARTVEAEAQTWRLPVLAYRNRDRPARAAAGAGSLPSSPALPAPSAPLAGVRVVDLTAMWAGPLTTWLLGTLGASVTKVESAVRPDGLRAQAAHFAALDRGKDHVELDLREPAARAELADRIAGADVVVDSFSPRVMPNLDLAPDRLLARTPRMVAVSIPAFPAGSPQREWVAYGTGIHAFAGLGDVGGGRHVAPAIAYPDPLAGLAAFAAAVEALAAGGGRTIDASLLAAVRPLADRAVDGDSLERTVEPVAAELADRLAERGFFEADGHPGPPLGWCP